MPNVAMAEKVPQTGLAAYKQSLPGVYDELRSAEGLRPQWESFAKALAG